MVDENKSVTCAENIGASIQKYLDGQNFASYSFQAKDKITNLQSPYSSISIDKEQVTIDPIYLFLRVVFVIKPEEEIENYFLYELTPYPTSVFKGGVLREAKTKSTLKKHLLTGIKPHHSSDSIVVADGGVLLLLQLEEKRSI